MSFKRKQMLPPREQTGNPQIRALQTDCLPQDSDMAFLSALAHGPMSPRKDLFFPLDASVTNQLQLRWRKAAYPSKGAWSKGLSTSKLPTAQLGAGAQLFPKSHTVPAEQQYVEFRELLKTCFLGKFKKLLKFHRRESWEFNQLKKKKSSSCNTTGGKSHSSPHSIGKSQ